MEYALAHFSNQLGCALNQQCALCSPFVQSPIWSRLKGIDLAKMPSSNKKNEELNGCHTGQLRSVRIQSSSEIRRQSSGETKVSMPQYAVYKEHLYSELQKQGLFAGNGWAHH